MQHPENFNYTAKITEKNARKQYYAAVKTMGIINIVLALLFLIINYEIVRSASSNDTRLSPLSRYLINGLLIVMVSIPVLQLIKSAKKN